MKRNLENQSIMAEINGSSLLHPNPCLQSLLHCLDPISLILSQNPDSDQPGQLSLTTESFIMERGPRYRAYAELRESRLRMRFSPPQLSEEPEMMSRILTSPPKKQVKFQTNLETTTKRKVSNYSSSAVAQSVPDFSSVLRKENRRPPMPTMMEMTPPPKGGASRAKPMSSSKGSKSAGAGDKRRPAAAARKSYASIEELKGFSMATANAINGGRRTVLGSRAL